MSLFTLPLFPSSRLVWIWDWITISGVLLSFLSGCYLAAFYSSLTWVLVCFYFADALHILDVVVRFFVAYKERGVVVRSLRKNAWRILKTRLIFDLLSVAPLEIFALATTDVYAVSSFLRINRLLRVYKVVAFFNQREAGLGVNTSLLRAVKFFLLAGASIHLQACIWYTMACYNMSYGLGVVCRPGTWANCNKFTNDLNVSSFSSYWDRYVITLYWTIATATVTGYGDIHPVTIGEKWFSMATMVWGITMFGYILGGLASILTNSDAMRARYKHRLTTIKEYLVEACGDDVLRKKVIGFYEYLWMRNKGNNSTSLFDELPRSFQAEVSLETFKTMMEKTPVLRKTSSGFRRMLSLVVKPFLYLPSQVIVGRGNVGHKMFFIHKGVVEVLDGSDRIATLSDGDVIGEVNLVYSVIHKATVRAVTHCDLLVLTRSDLMQILTVFPGDAKVIKNDIIQRCETAFQEELPLDVPIEEQLAILSSKDVCTNTGQKVYQSQQQSSPNTTSSILDKLTVTPDSRTYYTWKVAVAILVIITTWITCFQAGFSHYSGNISYNAGSGGYAVFAILYLIDLVFLVDIVLSLRTAILTPYGLIRMSRRMALKRVKTISFALDIFAVIPFELCAVGWASDEERWRYLTLFRLNRLVKLWKVYVLFSKLENNVNMPIGSSRAVKLLVSILTLVHITACIWFPLACFERNRCSPSSWAYVEGISPNSSIFGDYLVSLYWAATTMTSTGYGEITPHSSIEKVFSFTVMLVGLVLFGYTLSLIAATLTNSASIRVSFSERMVAVHQFMRDNKMDKGLLHRVDHYFELLWKQFKGETIPGGDFLMSDMPKTLQEDVKMAECQKNMDTVKFLQGTDEDFLRCLVLKTSNYLFAPGDYVLYYGDMGREMYCVRRGYVEILSEDLSQVVSILGPGDYFGELGLLFGTPRTATVRAATHCELIMLSKHHLDQVLVKFPIVRRQLVTIMENKSHMKVTCAAAARASCNAMRFPRQFDRPCLLTAMAAAMNPLLVPVVRTPLAPTIAACLGDEKSKLKVSCPLSYGRLPTNAFLKYKKEDEEVEQVEGGTGGNSGRVESGLRRRRKKDSVLPVSSSSFRRDFSEDCQPLQEEPSDVRTRAQIKEAANRIFSYCLMRYTFLPTSRACAVWELVVAATVFITVFTVSLQAAFFHFHPVLWIINYLTEAVFLVDMFLKLHTGYYTQDGNLITQPLACAKHYLKTNFLYDLLAFFPFELVALAAWSGPAGGVARVISLGRVNKMIRMYKLPLGFEYLEEKITNTSGLIKELKFAVYMIAGTHWTACLWFFIACPSIYMTPDEGHTCGENTWVHRYAELTNTTMGNQSTVYQYVVSLYWAVATTANVGYGDIYAYTDLERVFAVLVMTCGIVAYGYIIASVAASLANADSTRARFQERMTAIKNDDNMNSLLKKRVLNYYEFSWKRNKGVSFDSLFQGMPVSLQADISLSLYKKIIDQVPLFQNTEIGFTKLLALSIKPVIFLKSEYVVHRGDIGSEMFFINRGTVDVVSEDGNVVFASMGEGKFFGEISLVFSVPRTASIRAATNCDLFMLTKKDLDEALSHYPQIAEQIKEVAGSRADKVKKRAQIAKEAESQGASATDAAAAAAKGTSHMEEEGKRKSSAATTERRKSLRPELDDLLEIEEALPPRGFSCRECFSTCCGYLKARCWPPLKRVLTFTIPHTSLFNTVLGLLSTLAAFISVFTLTFQSIFQVEDPIFFVINYAFDAYFIVEMLLKFHITFEDEQGRTVTEFKLLVLHYLKQPTGFILDAAASFPFELVALPIPDPKLRVGVLLYLRLTHTLRLDRVQHFFVTEGKKLNQKTVVTRLLKFIVLISLFTQSVACLWYMLACQLQECRPHTWAVTSGMYRAPFNPYIHYTNSLYWAVATMTSTGYGELVPTNALEMLFACGVMVFGKLLFGFILGSIASTLANLETRKVQFEEKISAIKEYMKEKNLMSMMQTRVVNYFEYLWMRNKGVDRSGLFQDMPRCMQSEVTLSATEHLLRRVPVFADIETPFLRNLSLMVQPLIFLPGEYILKKGDIGFGIYLIHHGKVELIDDDTDSILEVLEEGQYFGQKSLVYHVPRDATVRALTHVDLFMVTREEFDKILEHHPSAEEHVSKVASEFYGIPVKKDRRPSDLK